MIGNRQLAVVEELLTKVKRKNALVHMQALRHCERTDRKYSGKTDRHNHRDFQLASHMEIEVTEAFQVGFEPPGLMAQTVANHPGNNPWGRTLRLINSASGSPRLGILLADA
jgi:hypothetical protein